MSVLEIVAVVAVVLYVMVRQMLGEPIRVKRLIVLPAVLAVVGAVDLTKNGRHPGSSDIVLLLIGGLVAASLGVGQGLWMGLKSRDGALWGQLPRRSVWLWVALYASRAVLLGVAHAVGAHIAGGSSAGLLTLGINRLAQAAAVALRALASGIPFAPEQDGARPLSRVFGAFARPTPDPRSSPQPESRYDTQPELRYDTVGSRLGALADRRRTPRNRRRR